MRKTEVWPESGKEVMHMEKNRIYITELLCYKKAPLNAKEDTIIQKHYFDLSLYHTEGQKREVQEFIYDRARRLSVRTVDRDCSFVRILGEFMNEKFPLLNSFIEVEEEILLRKFKAWMMENGYKITTNHHMKLFGKTLIEDAAPIKYLRFLLKFLQPEDDRPEKEKDVWDLAKLGFEVRQNPASVVKTIKFSGITQESMKEEVKQACYIELKYKAVGTMQGSIRAVRHFCNFLAQKYPQMQSLKEVDILVVEAYVSYMNLEKEEMGCRKTELAHLKSILIRVGKVLECPHLTQLFIKNDMPKVPEVLFRYYSERELKVLNEYLIKTDEQIARALVLQQMIGGRISDTLSLRTDCLYEEHGHYILRIRQVKTSYFEKPVAEETAALLQKAMQYTYEKYGETDYIFVDDRNPARPLQYDFVKKKVYEMIYENDIRDDNGNLMGFHTHWFRHRYGMQLTEMHLDDAVIAHLLGHRGVSTVCRYRKMSGKTIARETKEVREAMDEILSGLIKEWDGYEQVFQNA